MILTRDAAGCFSCLYNSNIRIIPSVFLWGFHKYFLILVENFDLRRKVVFFILDFFAASQLLFVPFFAFCFVKKVAVPQVNFSSRTEFLLKTVSVYPKNTGVTLFTMATTGNSLHYNTPRSALSVSTLAYSSGPSARQVDGL